MHFMNSKVTGNGKFSAVLTQASRHEDVLGSGDISPRILNFDTR